MLTQETLNNHILDIQCKAGNLAASWSNKVKLGKWCDEQECALVLADWGLDILCNHNICDTQTESTNAMISGIFQVIGEEEDYLLLSGLPDGTELELFVNGESVNTMTVQAPLLNVNYNFGELVSVLNPVMYNGSTEYETPQDLPVGTIVYYDISKPCNEEITNVYITATYPNQETETWVNTQPVPAGKDVQADLLITEGVCVAPCTSCFTNEQICELIQKLNKVLTFKCDCC